MVNPIRASSADSPTGALATAISISPAMSGTYSSASSHAKSSGALRAPQCSQSNQTTDPSGRTMALPGRASHFRKQGGPTASHSATAATSRAGAGTSSAAPIRNGVSINSAIQLSATPSRTTFVFSPDSLPISWIRARPAAAASRSLRDVATSSPTRILGRRVPSIHSCTNHSPSKASTAGTGPP